MISLHLPFPPSGNRAVRHANGRHYVDGQTMAYRNQVKNEVLTQQWGMVPYSDPVIVAVLWSPPDNRKRDGGNLSKTLLDALTKAGAWTDDSLAHIELLMRMPVSKPGKAMVLIGTIREYPELIDAARFAYDSAWRSARGD